MRWVLKRLKRHQRKSYRKRHHPNKDVCYYEPTEIVSIGKDVIDFISKDELIIKLAQELGPNGFNDWYRETFGKPAPYLNIKGSMGRFKSKQFKINKDLLEGEEENE